jgi:hypothetical protein
VSSLRFSTVLGSALFVFYCTAVGVYLVLRPWTGGGGGGGWTASGFFRGFVSGIGLVHLFAVGGIDESRLEELARFGDRISGVAAVRLVQHAADARAVVERIGSL